MANYRGSEINNEALGDEMHGFYGIERAPELFHALMPATFKFQGRGVVGPSTVVESRRRGKNSGAGDGFGPPARVRG